MSARRRLNEMYLYWAVFWAAVVGLAAHSWWAFAVILGGMVAVHAHAGNIRLAPRHRF